MSVDAIRFPSIDVVIPTLDCAAKLARCLAKLSSQKYPGEIRIVIVDGGSSDGTIEMARAFSRDIFVNPGQYMAGLTGSRQFGISRCHAELVWNVDSDNYLVEDTVAAELVRPLAQDDSVQISMPETQHVARASSFERWQTSVEIASVNAMKVNSRMCAGWFEVDDVTYGLTNSAMIRRSALETVGGFDSDVMVLERLRRAGLSKGAIVSTSHFVHDTASSPIEYIRRWNKRLKRYGRMTPDARTSYFVKKASINAGDALTRTHVALPLLKHPVLASRELLRTRDPTWVWGLAYPLLIGLLWLSLPVSAIRAARSFGW
jgi:glycosyltransferase involved in cell wall biosynthesis